MFYALVLAAALNASPSPSAARAPAAAPTASPVPQYSLDGAFSLYSAHTNGVNRTGALDTTSGMDLVSRTELSNGVLTLTKNTGPIRFTITGGAYAFPTVGQALNPTTQQGANAYLYGFVPLYSLSYVRNTHVAVSAGQLASLLGQESAFTFQNINVQRGLMWAAETTVSRGVRVTYTNAKVFGDLGYDDGFYAGNRGRTLDGLAGWSPTANMTWQFAFTVPGANTPGNPTAAIANKREYDLMLNRQFGKLQLLPYVLWVNSPASGSLGYSKNESATGFALLADYAFSSALGVAVRFESYGNASSATGASLNADLVGYGAGGGAATWTLTPAYHSGLFFARAELSYVRLRGLTPGLGFGSTGTSSAQNRVLAEMGVHF